MIKALEAARHALQDNWQEASASGEPNFSWLAECVVQATVDAMFPGDPIRAVYPWRTNSHLIYDVYKLGYIQGFVYDMTPGEKSAWTNMLWSEDTGPAEGIEEILWNKNRTDFRDSPHIDKAFDTVFYDPPYKLNGNPDGLAELSFRYGVDVPATVNERHALMIDGLFECLRITRRYLLVKCQDQVANNKVYWQTSMLKQFAESGITPHARDLDGEWSQPPARGRLVDRFDMVGHYIPQPMGPSKRYPKGRSQRHPHARPSTLLVFERI